MLKNYLTPALEVCTFRITGVTENDERRGLTWKYKYIYIYTSKKEADTRII